jgi:hypothetical protein
MERIYFIIFFFFTTVFLSYSYAITPEQIIALKKAGVSDKTIQIMLEQEKEHTKVVDDGQGNIYIIYSTGKPAQEKKTDITEEEKLERAWKLLENIIIDKRR